MVYILTVRCEYLYTCQQTSWSFPYSRVYQISANQNSFESSSLVTTCASTALFCFWKQNKFASTLLFNAVVLKRIWLRILIMTNKYSWQNWDQRKSPDNRGLTVHVSFGIFKMTSSISSTYNLWLWYCLMHFPIWQCFVKAQGNAQLLHSN